MGEVYRARDTRLHRDVAIKALPASLSADPERLARFQREARLLAALNHPNVAAIYGLEETDGSPFLVMECVEGETLAAKLAAGPLPVDEALAVAVQIAAGVAAAHEAGVIHRDLKPANVMVRPDGSVKVLDLGLARTVEVSGSDPSLSPTVTSGATGTGVILGTAAYMSPEQARGRPVDKRTDLFSFGCVLYECLTGQRAFPGETVSDSLAAILRAEPDWSALPANTPAAIRRLLARALHKDPKRRLQDMADARIEIEDAIASPRAPTVQAPVVESRRRQAAPILWAVGGLVLGIAAMLARDRFLAPAPKGVSLPVRAVLPLPPAAELAPGGRPNIAVSPDGRTVIFRAAEVGVPRLYRRALDGVAAEPIAGTEGGFAPFFSPDGEWLAFFTTTELKKVPLAGGAPISISNVSPVTAGGAWGADGKIVFTLTINDGLSRVSDGGGAIEPLSPLDPKRREHSHVWPQILPDGAGILVTMVRGEDFSDFASAEIVVLEADGRRTVVLEGSTFARYASGQIAFVRGGSVFRAPFDLSKLRVTGTPIPLGERIAIDPGTGVANFALTSEGDFVYAAGPPIPDPKTQVVRVDRRGVEQPLPLPEAYYAHPRLSPDGKTLAVMKCEGESCKLFLHDLDRNVLSPFTSESGRFFNPVFSPDGRRLAYSGFAIGAPALLVKNTDGSGKAERLTDAPTDKRAVAEFPDSWSPDGTVIAYVVALNLIGKTEGAFARDIWLASPDGRRQARAWLETPHTESAAAFSPDGRWMAYVSDESGRQEVYVRPFPGPGGRFQVSSNGGAEPVWTREGREIIYRRGAEFVAAEVQTDPTFAVAGSQVLFSADYARGGREDAPFEYAATKDGNSFYVIRPIPALKADYELAIVTNWAAASNR
jgi:serine/threonine-protein kinase